MTKAPKRPRDLNQWAKRMVDIATGETTDREPTPEEQGKDPAAAPDMKHVSTSYAERNNLNIRMHSRRIHSTDKRLLKEDGKSRARDGASSTTISSASIKTLKITLRWPLASQTGFGKSPIWSTCSRPGRLRNTRYRRNHSGRLGVPLKL